MPWNMWCAIIYLRRIVSVFCCELFALPWYSLHSPGCGTDCIHQGVGLKSVSWHQDGKQFVSGLSDGSLNFWNVRCPQKPASCMIPHCEFSAFYKLISVSVLVVYIYMNIFFYFYFYMFECCSLL